MLTMILHILENSAKKKEKTCGIGQNSPLDLQKRALVCLKEDKQRNKHKNVDYSEKHDRKKMPGITHIFYR